MVSRVIIFFIFVDVFAHKKNAKEKVFDTKERAVAPWKAPEIL